MRTLLLAAGLLALGTPAFADTLAEVTTHGIVLIVQGAEIPITFAPDGKFATSDGQITGAWRIDGDKLCTTSTAQPAETCVAYPEGKKSGDSFELSSPNGTVSIRIR